MSVNKSIRIRTTPGLSKNIQFKIEQDFGTIDFLSLSMTQEEVYRNFCSDYGVIAGRVIANDGFGIANAKVSVFIPLSDEDAQNPLISSVYPYVTPLDLNVAGVRYNLLPKLGREFYVFRNIPDTITTPQGVQQFLGTQSGFTPLGDFIGPWEEAENPSTNTAPTEITNNIPGYTVWRRLVRTNNGPRVPVGTFPSKMELLNDDITLEVYEKYYKFTTKTNQSGDYMIFGVPVGQQLLHLDVDLSDIGGSSLNPQDFINSGVPSSFFSQDGDFLKRSNLNSLPQIETQNISVDVIPFWGNLEQCEIGITRQDFNLTKEVRPSSILMFSNFGSPENYFVRLGGGGNRYGASQGSANREDFCNIQNQRQLGVRVYTKSLQGGYESTDDFQNGNVVLFIPMTTDRVITDELGSQVLSNDPNTGIPTTTDLRLLVHPLEEFPLQLDGNRLIGYGFFETQVKLKFDLNVIKPRIYTLGQYNQLDANSFWDLTIINNIGNNTQHPEVSDDREFIRGIRYGSLWFPRVRSGANSSFGSGASTIGTIFYPEESTYFNTISGYRYNALQVNKIIMDVTDVINLWDIFGGGLNSYTSKLDFYTDNDPNKNYSPYGVDLRNHTIPLRFDGGSPLPSVLVNFPNTLNTDQKPWPDDTITPVDSAYGGNAIAFNVGNIRSSWNYNNNNSSRQGRYCFYWGVDPNNSALHELKRRIF
jgi:hypothetical protein